MIAAALCGCVRSTTATWPDAWAPRSAAPPAAGAPEAAAAAPASAATPAAAASRTLCPQIAGRYADAGELAPGTPCRHDRTPRRGEYRCETSLSRNLGDAQFTTAIELRQPDADTLEIVSGYPTPTVTALHRSHGDYTCSARGLELALHASLLSIGDNTPSSAGQAGFNGVMTAVGLVSQGSGGVRTLTRTFAPAADGSLTMDVSTAETGLIFLIPFHAHEEGYVRWSRAPETPEASAAQPATPPVAAASASYRPSDR